MERAVSSGRLWVLLWMTLLACTSVRPAQAKAQDVDLAGLVAVVDSVAGEAVAARQTAGLSVAVAHRGDLLFAGGYGFANLEHHVPASAETVYRVGSVSKQFTAVAILQLVEQGHFGLEDDVREVLPDYNSQGRAVTIRHLLTHTSGIRSYTSIRPDHPQQFRLDVEPADLVARFQREPFDFEPGRDWIYNNSGIFLLGVIVEKVSGMPLAQYMAEHLFRPAGMTSSSYCDPRAIVPYRAAGYGVREGVFRNADPISMTVPGGAGAVCSTVLDLVRWHRALALDLLVSAASRREMEQGALLDDGMDTSYGFGLRLGDLDGHRQVGHSGVINGFDAVLAGYPDDGLTVTVLTNTEGGGALRIQGPIARYALGLPPAGAVRADEPDLEPYLGRFRSGGSAIEVERGPRGMRARLMGGDWVDVVPRGDGIFYVESDPAAELVFRAVDGSVVGVIHQVAGMMRFAARRVGS